MRITRWGILSIATTFVAFTSADVSLARDRVLDDFDRAEKSGDRKLSPNEWYPRGNFELLDTNHDGFLSLDEVRAIYAGHDDSRYDWPPPGMPERSSERDTSIGTDLVERDALDLQTLCGIGRSRKCDAEPSKALGLVETGLMPLFPQNAACAGIDDYYAMDYGFKRSREAYHGGIDMPARWGTPMRAVANGTVVGKYHGKDSARGIEIVLRHSPEDTGLAYWSYTQYGHLDKLPDWQVGQRVRMGDILGPTGNSGVSGKTRQQTSDRRPAIHFAVFYSEERTYADVRDTIIPVDGRWMDPIAFYRTQPPFDSDALKALPEREKSIPIGVLFEDGTTFPSDTKRVWPYACRHNQ